MIDLFNRNALQVARHHAERLLKERDALRSEVAALRLTADRVRRLDAHCRLQSEVIDDLVAKNYELENSLEIARAKNCELSKSLEIAMSQDLTGSLVTGLMDVGVLGLARLTFSQGK